MGLHSGPDSTAGEETGWMSGVAGGVLGGYLGAFDSEDVVYGQLHNVTVAKVHTCGTVQALTIFLSVYPDCTLRARHFAGAHQDRPQGDALIALTYMYSRALHSRDQCYACTHCHASNPRPIT